MPIYHCTHVELFVPAGHVGLLMNSKNEYLFAQPGMHNISSVFLRTTSPPRPLRGLVQHGNRTIVIIEQGYIGYAMDVYCAARGFLLDTGDRSLQNPEKHSIHCLVDVPICSGVSRP